MEVNLTVPAGTDISMIRDEYPDLYEDDNADDGYQEYWCGISSDEYEDDEDDEDDEWLTHDQAVEFCGFCEGAIPTAKAWIAGNGSWAQGMISQKDFSGLAVTDKDKAIYLAVSNIYWVAFERGADVAVKATGV